MSSTNAVSAAQYFGTQPAAKKSDLDMSTFLNLLVTQLQNQNPLEPMDDSAFYGQMAQLGQVQGMDKLNDSADLSQAQQLLGKTVSALRPTSSDSGKQGDVFTGVVSKIVFKDGNQYLGVQEPNGGIVEVQLSGIKSVLPSADVASASNLIGKTVAGNVVDSLGNSTNVIGTVAGLTTSDGQVIAEVKDSQGTIHQVPVSGLYQIAS